MMNIDRPLDEIVKETRQNKRQQLRQRRKQKRGGEKDGPASGDTKQNGMDVDSPAKDSPRVRGGIRKKRRSRGGDKVKADVEVERKHTKKATANQSSGAGASAPARKTNKGAKVSVSNLDHGVTQSDISELFETVGPLRSARLIVLNDGRSSGSAEVVFESMGDALDAIKRYNNVPLDNRPLKITLSTDSAPIRLSRGRRGGRKMIVDVEPGNSNSDGRESRATRRAASPRFREDRGREDRGRDFGEPAEKDSDRFYENERVTDGDRFAEGDRFADNDRFADGGRGSYSRRNGRRSGGGGGGGGASGGGGGASGGGGGGGGGRNSRNYDRRGASPTDNRRYVD